MLRRAFFAVVFTPLLMADANQEVYDRFESMASSLSQGDAEPFVDALDPSMSGYRDLAANVRALAAQTEVTSAIEVLTESGDATHQDVQLDWFLEITQKSDPLNLVRRRETVKCRLEKQKKKWRIVALEPAAFFAPPKIGQ